MMRNALLALLALLTVAMTLPACKPKDKGGAKTGSTKTTKKAKSKAKTKDKAKAKTKDKAKAKTKATAKNKADIKDDAGTIVPAAEGGSWVKIPSYGVKLRVPDDWTIKLDKGGATITDVDESTTIVIVGSKSTGMIQQAISDVKSRVSINDAKLQKTQNTTLNGMAGQEIRGTAAFTKKKDKEEEATQEIQFIAYNLRVNKDTGVTMMLFSEAEMYEAKKEVIEGLSKTLTKL